MLLEHAQHGDLKTFLRERRPLDKTQPLPDNLLHIKMVVGIVSGMDFVSQLGVVHRDLAARNCFVMSDETVKIGDFGRAILTKTGMRDEKKK
jgi:serine/threonine protein kinase